VLLVKEVGVGVFDAVVVGDWEAVGVRVVDGGGAGDHGFGRARGLAPTICGALGVAHGTRAGDPENAAGPGALLAPEADAELDALIAFFVAPGVDAVCLPNRAARVISARTRL
jgi:hypothetical protein